MRARCYGKNQVGYQNYGGRGILICARWSNFKNFLIDMGERPSANFSLERKDNNGNYEPGNCKWATRKEQNNNKRKHKNNSSGITGVRYVKHTQTWIAQAQDVILYRGKDFFEACCTRKSWEARSIKELGL